MLIEEKSSGKECISVLDGFTLDREKLIGPQIYQFLLNAIVSVRLSPEIGLKKRSSSASEFQGHISGKLC